MFIWELPDWPHFRWDADRLAQPLGATHLKQGRLLGRLERPGFALQVETELQATTEAAVKNAEIEGDILNRDSVRSSIARRLGVPDAALGPEDRRVEGIVEMTLDATRNYAAPLTRQRLFSWQAALFPTGRSGLQIIRVGAWRDDAHGPMQVVSAPFGRERVHFQAPPAERVEAEMQALLEWFNPPQTIDGIPSSVIVTPSRHSMTVKGRSSIDCSTGSKASSRHASGWRLPNARHRPPSATSKTSSTEVF